VPLLATSSRAVPRAPALVPPLSSR
jgi:hypothetical protein